MRFLSYPGQVFAGRVTLVGPTLDPASRTVAVKLDPAAVATLDVKIPARGRTWVVFE